MKFVVTGGMGFIGTSVIKRLLGMDHEVVCVDFVEDQIRLYETHRFPILKDVYRNLQGCSDVMNPNEYLYVDLFADGYIHLGACVDTREIHKDLFNRNVSYMRAFVDNLPYDAHVVFGSSAAVYGEHGYPNNPYGMTKAIGESLLRKRMSVSSQTTILRFFNVFGRHEHHKAEMASLPFKLASAYKRRERFKMWSPNASRDFVSVDEVTDAVIGHALNPPVKRFGKSLCTFDVGRGESVELNDLDYMLRVIHGRDESTCDIVDIPKQYVGRYQFYTKAGSRAEISPYMKTRDINDTLRDHFIDA